MNDARNTNGPNNDLVIEMAKAMPLPLIVIGRDERVVVANEKAEELFGKGVQGRHYITVLRQPMLLDAIENVLRLGEAAQAPYRVSESSKDLHFDVKVRPAITQDAGYVVVAFEDKTDLQEASQMRRDFVANVSHELRTPLTALLGFIETLLGPAANDTDARKRFLSIMDNEAKRMNRIVGDLLSLSRVEADRRVRPRDPVNVPSIVRSVVQTLQPLAGARNVSLRLEGADAEDRILGDQDQLTQVFTNLIENAIKYGPNGGEVSICITSHAVEPTMQGPAVRVDIADQGEGIPVHHIPRLTERFYRVDAHRSREMGGTGLGLAIVKHILNRHRGRLRIESHAGNGSCFSVILPYE
ncbi:ATP-binding protein [Pacificibacter marinus]|uniref:histidine kinase n=1 Tax=Pacificibacter marinus TaxID=658057 RepID=A0A1Y5T4A5_9RHOB|nr:ATP-binding protein [Pacificibacter marinus]SEK98107.1 two-component system, OmpR family, phosphate regulon sensor histidine kinase PhoR [Pacificibacter marinus]SLN53853.1 Alkaline phosphatase synthesis sensor protein PhoR [Pacificibacter marinus]